MKVTENDKQILLKLQEQGLSKEEILSLVKEEIEIKKYEKLITENAQIYLERFEEMNLTEMDLDAIILAAETLKEGILTNPHAYLQGARDAVHGAMKHITPKAAAITAGGAGAVGLGAAALQNRNSAAPITPSPTAATLQQRASDAVQSVKSAAQPYVNQAKETLAPAVQGIQNSAGALKDKILATKPGAAIANQASVASSAIHSAAAAHPAIAGGIGAAAALGAGALLAKKMLSKKKEEEKD